MDDIQDYWITSAQVAAMNVFLSENLPLDLGLIMHDIGDDSTIIDKVNEGFHRELFHLAVHGWDHVNYTELSDQDQKNTILMALEKMQRLFGIKSNIFIPPYDAFNNATIKAIKDTGFRILSSALWAEDDFNGNKDVFVTADIKKQNNSNQSIYHLPATVSFDDYEDNKTIINSNKDIFNNVTANISTNGYAVIVIHPQDFTLKDQKGEPINVVDENRKRDLLSLIDLLLSNNIHITSFYTVVTLSPPLISSVSTHQIIPPSIVGIKINKCMPGFYITGYFTPVESDYKNNTKKMAIPLDNMREKTFNEEFIRDVKMQGWGKTLEGWYLGYYDNTWHNSSFPLGINHKPLSANSVSTDPKVIPSGNKLVITTLPKPYNSTIFSADDIVTDITGKTINIYMGEGRSAQDKAFKITGSYNDVCLIS